MTLKPRSTAGGNRARAIAIALLLACGSQAFAADLGLDPSNAIPIQAQARAQRSVIFRVVGQLGGAVTALAVEGERLYAGQGTRLAVYTLTDRDRPQQVGASPILPDLMLDLVVQQGLAYALLQSGGLVVLDVSNPQAPSILHRVSLPDLAAGRLHASGDRLLVAAGDLTLIDIAQPEQAQIRNRYFLPAGASVAMAVGDLVIVGGGTLPGSGVGSPGSMVTLDLRTGQVASGLPLDSGIPWDMVISGSFLFTTTGRYLTAYDISDPTALQEVDQLRGNYGHLTALGQYLVTTGQVLSVIQVYPNGSMQVRGRPSIRDSNGLLASGVDRVYVTRDVMGLSMVNISDPDRPYVRHGLSVLPYPTLLAVEDNQALLASGFVSPYSLDLLDLNQPEEPRFLHGMPLTRRVRSLALEAGLLCHADSVGSDHRLMVRSGSAPWVTHAQIDLSAPPTDMQIKDSRLYLGQHEFVQVLDLSNPQQPVQLGMVDNSLAGLRLSADLPWLYVLGSSLDGRSSRLLVQDISNPAQIIERSRLSLPAGTIIGDALSSELIAASSVSALHVVDVQDPTAPRQLKPRDLPQGHIGRGLVFLEERLLVLVVIEPSGANWLVALDLSDPAQARELGRYRLPFDDIGIAIEMEIGLVGSHLLLPLGRYGLRILQVEIREAAQYQTATPVPSLSPSPTSTADLPKVSATPSALHHNSFPWLGVGR